MFCKHCGSEVANEAKFCPRCGEGVNVKLPASVWKRLANYLIDYFASMILVFLLVLIFSLITKSVFNSEDPGIIGGILGIIIGLGYYLFFEGKWQRTPGKWATGTKVVRLDGTKPTFGQILGRTFSRYIPFEPLSFLVNGHPMSWHDRLPNTLVVPADYTPEDVKNINLKEAKKGSGATIVVIIVAVLVIMAIVGILAAVVLASLNSARQKGLEAAQNAENYQQTLPVGSVDGQPWE